MRQFFVTTALPYANGSFHLGHIMEFVQADIYVRTLRMSGHEVFFVCADDAHGAPIMLKADSEGITPQELVARIAAERPAYLKGFHVDFDFWHSTDAPNNHTLAQEVYQALKAEGLIETREIEQFFDPVKGMFLPDRFIKGNCPKCDAADQYGDACESCGAIYAPTELKNPYSAITKATPVLKRSEHFFFKLSDPRCVQFMKAWTNGKNAHGEAHLQDEVCAKTKEWLGESNPEAENHLNDWDISRDAPYFGIEIPDAPGKYFYVWLDAPIGYLASLQAYCESQNIDYKSIVAPESEVEQVHFIGKDILYFHALFWPAMLHFSGRKTPDRLNVHGFVTVNGQKMSKSRGTGISPLKYLELGMNPEWMRYYLAAKMTSRVEDIDFNAEDFVLRVNSDLVGKYVNIASRASGFLVKRFDGLMAYADKDALRGEIAQVVASVQSDLENREYARAIRTAMSYADQVNKAFDEAQPWVINKAFDDADEAQKQALQHTCSAAVAGFRALSIMLTPILPAVSERVARELFDMDRDFQWKDAAQLPLSVNKFKHLMQRVEPSMLDDLLGAA